MYIPFTARALPALLLAGLILIFAPSAQALSMTAYTLDELWSESQMIVKGEVVKTRFYRDKGRIFTEVTLTPTSPLFKGVLKDSHQHVRFSLPGGDLAGLTQYVPGVPRVKVGEELFLFLRCSSPGTCSPVGFGQGMWHHKDGSWAPLTGDVHWVGEQVI